MLSNTAASGLLSSSGALVTFKRRARKPGLVGDRNHLKIGEVAAEHEELRRVIDLRYPIQGVGLNVTAREVEFG